MFNRVVLMKSNSIGDSIAISNKVSVVEEVDGRKKTRWGQGWGTKV